MPSVDAAGNEVPSQSTSAAVQDAVADSVQVGDGIAGTGNFIAGRIHIDEKPAGAIPTSTSITRPIPFCRRSRRAKTPRPQRKQSAQYAPEWWLTFAFFLFAIFRNAVKRSRFFVPLQ